MNEETVKKAAAGIRRLFIMRDTDKPMPSFEEIAQAALEAAEQKSPEEKLLNAIFEGPLS